MMVGMLLGFAVACGGFVLFANTGKQQTVRQVSEVRVVQPSAATEHVHGSDMQAAPPQAEGPSLSYKTPDGWRDVGKDGMRVVNLRAGADDAAECYATVLSGTGGGVAMNVNRWRAQMGLPEAGDEDIANLPTIPMLSGKAVFIDLAGTFGGMDDVHTGTETRESFALLGAILMRDKDAVFLKMTGPEDVLKQERENFVALAASLQDGCCPHHGSVPTSETEQ